MLSWALDATPNLRKKPRSSFRVDELAKRCVDHNTKNEGDEADDAEQRIDAHTPPASGRRNESVFAQQKFTVAGRTRRCELRLQLLEETSSGGHMFKVKDLSLGSNDAALLEDAGMATFTTGGLR